MPLTPDRFGLSCALITPMHPDGSIDLVRLAAHAGRVLARGCDTITLYGTTGEGASIGLADRDRMLGAVIAAGIDPVTQVYAGVAAASLPDAVAQGRTALEAGVRGLLVAPPFYFKNVGQDGVYAWFAEFLEKLGPAARGVFLYHIPSVTAVDIGVDLVQRLKTAFPGVIAGVKDSSSDFPTTEAFLKAHGELAILVGDERLLARAVRQGAQGSICGLANLAPDLLRPLVYEGQESATVDRLVDEIVSYPVLPAVKALVGHLQGDPSYGTMRPPLQALGEADRQRLFAAFDAIARPAAA